MENKSTILFTICMICGKEFISTKKEQNTCCKKCAKEWKKKVNNK